MSKYTVTEELLYEILCRLISDSDFGNFMAVLKERLEDE